MLDDNLLLVKVLLSHGADINKTDVDSWTPLHAAAANGHSGEISYIGVYSQTMRLNFADVARHLIEAGASTQILTEDGETPLDLVESDDLKTMAVLLNTKIETLKKKISQTTGLVKTEPAWVRKESTQGELGKKKLTVITKKCNEIADSPKVRGKDEETSTSTKAGSVKSEKNSQQERKRRIGQSDPLLSLVNSKLSQKDSKDRI